MREGAGERERVRKIKGKLLNLCVTYLNGAEQRTETVESGREGRGREREEDEHDCVHYFYRAKR